MKETHGKPHANRKAPVLIVILLILLVAAAGAAGEVLSRFLPTREHADLGQIYGNEEGYAAIIANHQLLESRALWQLGHAYLPYSVITEELNSRFYWDPVEELLLYTLPSETRQADTETAFDGASVLLQENGQVYISLSYVESVSNIRVEHFENPNRLVLQTQWGTERIGTLKKKAAVRVLGGPRSKILTELQKGDQVVILNQMKKWSEVQTPDGFLGYMQNAALGELQEVRVQGPYEEPVYTWTQLEKPVSMAWHQVFGSSGLESMKEFLAQSPAVNTISPTWFSVASEDGSITSLANAEYVSLAHEAGLEVWPVLAANIDIDIVSADLLQPTSRRRRLIENVMRELEACGADGLNVDFEEISAKAGEGFIQMIRELSVACRERGLILSVDNGVSVSGVMSRYHIQEQGVVADYVVVMAYDEHTVGTSPGSTASLPFVRQAVEDALRQVPAEKLICGIPLYTRLWTSTAEGTSSEAVGMGGAAAAVEEYGMSRMWLDDLAQNYGRSDAEGVSRQIWLEDAESMKARLQMLATFDLAGIAFWKLGLETPDVWEPVRTYLGQ